MDLLTIALIVIAVWFAIALLLVIALGHAAKKADEVTERLLAAGRVARDPLEALSDEIESADLPMADPAAEPESEAVPVHKPLWKRPLHRPRPYGIKKLLH